MPKTTPPPLSDPSSATVPQLREVGDARTLRALSHPVRIALIEALSIGGPMTATQVGEQIGESPTTCSFHLRQLARYGFVEEAGGGKGRARPWRMSSLGMRIGYEDPAAETAASALGQLLKDRQLGRYQTWLETKAGYPEAWRRAALQDEYLIFLTLEELEQLHEELLALLMPRFRERLADPSQRPVGSLPVELLLLGYPIRPPRARP